jgi:hypothetical protein
MDGGFALFGAKGEFESEDWDFWLVRTNAQGITEFPSLPILVFGLSIVLFLSIIFRQRIKGGKHEQN